MSIAADPRERVQTDPLSPVLSQRYVLHLKHVLMCVGCGAFFLYLNYTPIFHSDIWGHVNYGKWILAHRGLPAEDPFTPLAGGVPVTDTAWLGQTLFALAETWGGTEWVSNLFALTVLITYLVLMRALYLRSGSLPTAALGAALVWLVGIGRYAIVRPEIFGGLCFAVLLWLVARVQPAPARRDESPADLPREQPWGLWIGVPLLFIAWANLHGSFIVGIAVLGCLFLGRVIEVAWRERNAEALLADAWCRRWLLLTELAVVACVVNPYGIDLLINVATFSKNQNLKDILEWYPLKLVDLEGIQFSATVLLFLVLLRHSSRRFSPADMLMLAVFAWAVAPAIRMIGWYAPVFVFVVAPHLADLVRRVPEWPALSTPPDTVLSAKAFRYTALVVFAAWVSFAFSPTSRFLLGGSPRPTEHLYSSGTPLGISKYLREHPHPGQMWNPQWWGDWLVFDGVAEPHVFMTTNAVHVAPRQVWRDYMTIANLQTGWERALDRYRVNTLVVDKKKQPAWDVQVRRLAGWVLAYEDDDGIVAIRSSPAAGPQPAASQPGEPKHDSQTASPATAGETSPASTPEVDSAQPR